MLWFPAIYIIIEEYVVRNIVPIIAFCNQAKVWQKLKAAFNVDDAAIRDNQGAYKVTVSSSIISRITPCIYHDLRGQLWYIESPIEGLVLPELCLHFLIISALCNIMRYSPHNWSNILTNKVSPQYSLLISKYLRLFEIKYPMLVSELITNYVPVIAEK